MFYGEKHMKRIFSTLLTFVIGVSFTVSAFAADESQERKLKDYICFNYSEEEVEEFASRIARDANYLPQIHPYGFETAEVEIRISTHPEILNPHVFQSATKKMVEQSKNCFEHLTDHTYVLNNVRLGGELAFHIALLLLLEEFEEYSGDPTYAMLYEKFDYAEMNADEHRLPLLFMMAAGVLAVKLIP